MTAAAFVAHQIPGRVRLKVPSEKGNPAYFAVTARSLSACPGVEELDADFRTASLLLHHAKDIPYSEIAQWARARGLFDLVEGQTTGPNGLRAAAAHIDALDAGIRDLTRGAGDLRSIMFLMFIGLGLVQVARGQVMPAATALFWYALELLPRLTGGPQPPDTRS